jgi:hypothetical protein
MMQMLDELLGPGDEPAFSGTLLTSIQETCSMTLLVGFDFVIVILLISI